MNLRSKEGIDFLDYLSKKLKRIEYLNLVRNPIITEINFVKRSLPSTNYFRNQKIKELDSKNAKIKEEIFSIIDEIQLEMERFYNDN